MFLQKKPNYEKLGTGMLLAASAGSLDAYTFLTHGGVFAGFQTGNILKLSMNLGQGHFKQAGIYLFSIITFVLGTFLMRLLQHQYKLEHKLARATVTVFYEILLLLLVFLVRDRVPNFISVSILTLAATAQLQEFRIIEGFPYNSLMMTNNLRTITESFYDYRIKHDPKAGDKGRKIFVILLSLIVGATLNSFLVTKIGTYTIFVSIFFLVVAIIFSHLAVRHVIGH